MISRYASSTVVGPWNEESLWNRAGELGMGDVKSHRLDRLKNSSHECGRVFLYPQCANLPVYIRAVPCPLNYCCCCLCCVVVCVVLLLSSSSSSSSSSSPSSSSSFCFFFFLFFLFFFSLLSSVEAFCRCCCCSGSRCSRSCGRGRGSTFGLPW